jgi:hypothetical protein
MSRVVVFDVVLGGNWVADGGHGVVVFSGWESGDRK